MSFLPYTIIYVEPHHNPNEGRNIINTNFSSLGMSIDSISTSGSSDSGWSLTGNSNIISGTSFLGTINNVPLTFRVNNIQSGKIDGITGNAFYGIGSGLFNTTGTSNSAIGHYSLKLNLIGINNTAIGATSLFSSVGSFNTAVGYGALHDTTASENTAVGYGALQFNTTATKNSSLGVQSLYANTIGSGNTAIGHRAGYVIVTGSSNTFLGSNSDSTLSNISGSTAIGANSVVSQSGALILGGTGVYSVNVGVGTPTPNTSAILDLSSTAGALLVPRMTSVQMSALTAVNGMVIYDTTTSKFSFYNNGWVQPF